MGVSNSKRNFGYFFEGNWFIQSNKSKDIILISKSMENIKYSLVFTYILKKIY